MTIEDETVQDWIDNHHYTNLNQPKESWVFQFQEKPATNSNVHAFQVRLIFASGRTIEVQLDPITWN